MTLNDVATQAMLKVQEDSLTQKIVEDLILRAGLYPYLHGQVRGGTCVCVCVCPWLFDHVWCQGRRALESEGRGVPRLCM